MATILTKIFGSRNDRLLGKYRKTVARINALEKDFEQLSDEQIPAKTAEFRERVAKGETLDAILPEAFALVREASKRIMKMRHFDVQMIGGLALHEGKIMHYRAHRDVHAQLPADALSVSLNIMHSGGSLGWMDQYNSTRRRLGCARSSRTDRARRSCASRLD